MKALNVAASVIMGVLLSLVVIGCQSDSQVNVPNTPDVQNEPVIANTELDGPVVTPIALPRGTTAKPVRSVSFQVTPSSGGTGSVTMQYTSATTRQLVQVQATLTVPAGAVPGTKTITMTIDTSVAGVQFSPKGLKFTGWSLLTLSATGLDPIPSTSNIGFYYFDDKGNSEVQNWSILSINTARTSIFMAGGTVPHFSRYAFGRRY